MSIFLFALMLSIFNTVAGAADDEFVVLSYHDVSSVVESDASFGKTAVSTENLVKQFEWLQQEHYHVISIDDLLQARTGRRHLPNKSVLLTFDDGYASFYQVVFPLLKKYRYPAVVSVVGSWMEARQNVANARDSQAPSSDQLMTWGQINELGQSGWVEIASHSYALHQGILGNPQGNQQPAGVTRVYDPISKTYETDAAYRQRIHLEFKAAAHAFLKHTGKMPRVMVWPYGEANRLLIQEAKQFGMSVTFGLGDGHNTLGDLPYLRRLMVAENPAIEDFSRMMLGRRDHDRPLHVVHVDLDYIHDIDPMQTERNLGLLLDRIKSMGVNTVYLQAFSDPDGDGIADALYFPNRHLPVSEDLFNRAAWQLQTRTRVKVYAWMPVLAFKLKVPDAWFVHEWRGGDAAQNPAAFAGNRKMNEGVRPKDLTHGQDKAYLSTHPYQRLSPFNSEARRIVGEIYQDLAKYANFSGILFHDDAILTDYEDVTPQALRIVARQWKLPTTPSQLRGDPVLRMKWAKHKSQLLVEWTDFLAGKVSYYHPDIKTARNYYALPILQPDSEEWFAQSFAGGLSAYDYVAIEAMPYMEKAQNPDRWLGELVKQVATHPDGLKKSVFELQTIDWNTKQKIPMETFLRQLKLVQGMGGVNLGYYPDNVFDDYPRLEDMERTLSLPRFP